MMVDFTSNILAGLEAHQEAVANRNEVLGTLDALKTQLLSVTKEKVTIEVAEIEISISESLSWGTLSSDSRASALLLVSSDYPELRRRVCLIRIPTGGYPVTLKFGSEKTLCHDRASLEEALAEIMGTAVIGRAISELMEYKPAAAGQEQ